MIDEPTNNSTEEIPKESKNNTSSLSEQIKKLAHEKIDNGFELKDKNSYIELRKNISDELKINKNSISMIRSAIKDVAIEKKIQISDLGFKNDKIGDVIVNLVKGGESEPSQEPNIQSNISKTSQSPLGSLPQNTSNSSRGVLPKGEIQTQTQTEQLEQPEKETMTKKAQSDLIHYGLVDVIFPLYTSMGLIELSEEEKKKVSKIQSGEQAKQQFSDLADKLNAYLEENNIELPQFLNHISILVSIFAVMVLPVIKFKMFSSKEDDAEPNYDDSAEKIEVKT